MELKSLIKGLGIVVLAAYIIVITVIIAIPDEPRYTVTCQRELAGDYMRFHIIRSKLKLTEETQVYNWPGRNAFYMKDGKRKPFNLKAER